MLLSIGEFVALNAMVLLFLASYMKFRQPQVRRVRLRMGVDRSSSKLVFKDEKMSVMEPEPVDFSHYAKQQQQHKSHSMNSDRVKALNVIFTWNGHSWDAYEVLGLPAGSSMTAVTQAYDKTLRDLDESSKGLVQKAYHCICNRAS